MPVYNASKLFATPKKRGRPTKAKTARMCAPKLPYSVCTNAEKRPHCTWVEGKKRRFCRTKKNRRS